jgi:6-phosphogluconolactonase
MNNRELVICRDAADLNKRAAEEFIRLSGRAVQCAARFTVALSGGLTPRGLYELLASDSYKERIPWSKVHFFWGDERCVAPDHPDSNYRMAREALLARISIPVENIHRMAGEKEPAAAARDYENELKKFFHLADGALPRFDLILLGLGEEGHTASLFPGSAALAESKRMVAAHYVEKLKAHRLTLTLPVLNHGAEVVFLVAGSNKAEIVKEVLAGGGVPPELPAARVRPFNGHLAWMVTRDAAALLGEELS